MTRRFSLTILILLLVIILPWWLNALLLLSFIFLWPWYYEAIVPALIFDLLYGSGNFYLTMAIIIIIPLAEEIKKRLYVFG